MTLIFALATCIFLSTTDDQCRAGTTTIDTSLVFDTADDCKEWLAKTRPAALNDPRYSRVKRFCVQIPVPTAEPVQ